MAQGLTNINRAFLDELCGTKSHEKRHFMATKNGDFTCATTTRMDAALIQSIFTGSDNEAHPSLIELPNRPCLVSAIFIKTTNHNNSGIHGINVLLGGSNGQQESSLKIITTTKRSI